MRIGPATIAIFKNLLLKVMCEKGSTCARKALSGLQARGGHYWNF